MADEYGLTSAGFRIKRLRQILTEFQDSLNTVKDPDTGETLQVNFDEDDPFIQFVNLCCDELSAIWAVMNAAYDQFDPMKATGPMLSSLVQLNGITRKLGEPSIVIIRFTGSPGVYIPAGTRVTDADEKCIWKTQEEATVPSGGFVDVTCYSQENGAFNFNSGTINVLMDTISNITAVVNPSSSTAGSANESDIDLRRRRAKSTETPSQGLAQSIYGSIVALDGVDYCKIITNRTMETDSYGIPRKSVAIVVQVEDRDNEDLKLAIAKAIFLRAGLGEEFYAPGVEGDGSFQQVLIRDVFSQITPIRFIYPAEIPIYMEVIVSDLEDSSLPDDYETQIRTNIIAFAKNGVEGLGLSIDSTSSFDDYGFPPGDDVVVSRLYTAINAVRGCKVNSLKIGLSEETLATDNIEIDWFQIASFLADNITVIREA